MKKYLQKINVRNKNLVLVSLLAFLFSWGFAQEDQHLYAKVKRLEGQGNGGVWLNLTSTTMDNIMSGAPWKVQQPEYEPGTSPVLVKVTDPGSLQNYDYVLKIAPTASSLDNSLVNPAAHWTLTWYQNGTQLGSYTSQHSIGDGEEEVIPGHGIAIIIRNAPFAIHDEKLATFVGDNGGYTFRNNSWYAQPDLIGSALTYNGGPHWLDGLTDANTSTPDNWIRAGKRKTTSKWECNIAQTGAECEYSLWRQEDFFNLYHNGYEKTRGFMDYYGQFGNIAGGFWAPYVMSSPYDGGPKANYFTPDVDFSSYSPNPACYDFQSINSVPNIAGYNQTLTNLYSVDIVLTPDQSKWTRALVLEAGSGNPDDYMVTQHFNGQTYQNIRHEPKKCPSVDKNGNPDNSGTTGYGWFPGYAINVETGERLNIMFAENSEDEYNHGNDMIFNPTNVFAFQKNSDGSYVLDDNGQPIPMTVEEYNALYSSNVCDHVALGEPLYGGRHFVYVCGSSGNTANTFYRFSTRQRNYNDDNQTVSSSGTSHGGTFTGTDGVTYPYYECGVYDEGKWLGEKFKTLIETNLNSTPRKTKKMQVFNNVMWTGIPMPAVGQESNWLATDAIINIRVSRPYMFYSSAVGTGPENATNNNAPTFSFTTSDLGVPQNYDLYNMTTQVMDNDNRLDINNVDAPLKPQGGGWFFDDAADYHVPKGTDKTSYFCYSFWMGAQDANGSLHLFAERFNQVGRDTWPGPLSTVDASIDENTMLQWNRTFKITREEVMDFLANYQTPGYTIPHHILDWPAHGDTTKGQSWLLAPFVDADHDGVYNPAHGDHPDFPGDMAQFLIFNDNYSMHTESQGLPLGVEMHVLAYAYDAPEDSIMNNTIFLKYKIFNRSSTSYDNTYIGLWSDWDLGYAYDDYVGCDVMKNTAYCYNGSGIDGSGQSWSYGENWPVQTLTLLAGPYLPADGLDNPAYTEDADCSQFVGNGLNQYAINGSGFGDGIVDNERFGLTGFVYHNNDNSVTGDPQNAPQYFNLMRSIWLDGTHMRYGANGHPSNGATGPECNFMFPSLSDNCNFGTQGVDPMPSLYGADGWTEANVGNAPYDRRGLASVGPFRLEAGGMQELELAFVTIPHSLAVTRFGINLDNLSQVDPNYRSQNFLPAEVINIDQTICEGETYTFQGNTYSETGSYRHYVRNAAYSNDIPDTIYNLNLTVIPFYTLIYADILPGQGYHENGFNISNQETANPGTHIYTQPLTSVSGCDNMMVLFLDVRVDAGVNDHTPNSNFKIYPNPTSDYVIVKVDEEWAMNNNEDMMLYDINGKLLRKYPFEDAVIRVDMSDFPAGFYMIKVGNSVGKIIKK